MPRLLRGIFRKRRELLLDLSQCSAEAIAEYMRTELAAEVRPGIVVSIATSGDMLQWHPHGHLLVTDGAFSDDGTFHPLATWDMDTLMRLFRERLLARLVDKHAISQELAKRLISWTHPGFSAHVGEPIAADNTQALENVAGYAVRNPLSLQRLVYLDGQQAVIYKGAQAQSDPRTELRDHGPAGMAGENVGPHPGPGATSHPLLRLLCPSRPRRPRRCRTGAAQGRGEAGHEAPLQRKLGKAHFEGLPRRSPHMREVRRQARYHRVPARSGLHLQNPRSPRPWPARHRQTPAGAPRGGARAG